MDAPLQRWVLVQVTCIQCKLFCAGKRRFGSCITLSYVLYCWRLVCLRLIFAMPADFSLHTLRSFPASRVPKKFRYGRKKAALPDLSKRKADFGSAWPRSTKMNMTLKIRPSFAAIMILNSFKIFCVRKFIDCCCLVRFQIIITWHSGCQFSFSQICVFRHYKTCFFCAGEVKTIKQQFPVTFLLGRHRC